VQHAHNVIAIGQGLHSVIGFLSSARPPGVRPDARGMEPYPELGKALMGTALDDGLIMRIDPTWFAVAPALIASKSDIDEMCSLIDRSLVQALEAVGAKHSAAV